jgi:GT2 family glycosyltransferase
MTNKFYNDLTIIIVAFNSNELLIECVDNVKEYKIIIVDNGKNEKIFPKLNYQNNNIKIITKNKNLGFPKAINFAVESIKTNYFLILNADTFISKESINNLLKTCKKYENCGAAAPITEHSSDGYDLFPENGKGIKRTDSEKKKSIMFHNFKPDGEICVEVAKLGLMINLKNFLAVKKFNENYFMFWEEIDLCRKFRKHNFSVIVNPLATLIHKEKKSSNKDLITFLIKNFHLELSPLIYFNIKKTSNFLYFRLLKYTFRTISYLCILNLKKSLNNIIKLGALFYYIFIY